MLLPLKKVPCSLDNPFKDKGQSIDHDFSKQFVYYSAQADWPELQEVSRAVFLRYETQ